MKPKIIFQFVIFMLILSVADLNAQVKEGTFSVNPFIGYNYFSKRSVLENASTYGISLGYNFSQNFGLEGSYNNIDTKIIPEGVTTPGSDPDGPGPAPASDPITVVPGGVKVSGSQVRVEGIYYIYPGKKFAPYVAIGVGMLRYDYYGKNVSQMNFPAGVGIKYFVTDKIALRADVHSVVPTRHNNIIATVGATFQF